MKIHYAVPPICDSVGSLDLTLSLSLTLSQLGGGTLSQLQLTRANWVKPNAFSCLALATALAKLEILTAGNYNR